MLHKIIGEREAPIQLTRARIIQIAIGVLLLGGCVYVGLRHPELARALVEAVMLLVL